MALNFQDVIRDVHDPVNHALQTTGSIGNISVSVAGQATVNIAGAATIFAVVNTSAAGQASVVVDTGKNWIGLASISGGVNILSAPTINAVVNTAAAGQSSVVLDTGSNWVGLASISGSVNVLNLFNGIVTVANPTTNNNIVTVANPVTSVGVNGNVTISDSKGFIGLVSVSGFANPLPVTGTFYQATQPVSFGNVTISDSKGFIGLTSIQGNVNLNAGVNNIGFATVAISNPTLYAVVNTGAAGVQNSIVTINPRTDYFGLVSVSGNVAVSSLPATPAGANFIGLVTVANTVPTTWAGNVTIQDGGNSITIDGNVGILGNVTLSDPKTYIGLTSVSGSVGLNAGANFIGLVTVSNTVSTTFSGNVTLDAGSKTQVVGNVTLSDSKGYIGLTSVSGSVVNSAGVNWIGFATVDVLDAWPDPKTYIGLVTVANTVPVTFSGNVTLSDAKTYIGLTTTTIGNNPVLGAGVNGIGFATVNVAGTLPALSASPAFIGIVTQANQPALVNSTANIGFATVYLGTPTINAVVNTGSATDPKIFIGLTTTKLGASPAFIGIVTITNQPALVASAAYIGLATTINASSTANIGSVSVLGGGIGINAGVNNIGFASTTPVKAWPNPNTFIGLVTSSNVAWANPNTYIGLVTSSNVAWANPNTFIGLVTAVNGLAWPDPKVFIGLATTVNGAGTQFIGLVTAVMGNNPTISSVQYSYYRQSSLISGYVYHGVAAPGSNPTTANFRIQRESLNFGDVLFASGVPTFTNAWSAASLASITYL